MLEREGLSHVVCRKLGLDAPGAGPRRVARDGGAHKAPAAKPVRIALVGKYVQLHDAYLSVVEALNHAGL